MITLRASAAAALEVRVHSKLYPRPVAAPPARGTGAGHGTIATTCRDLIASDLIVSGLLHRPGRDQQS